MVLRTLVGLLLRFLLPVQPAVVALKRNQLLVRKTEKAFYVLAVLLTGQSRAVRRRSACRVACVGMVLVMTAGGVRRNAVVGMMAMVRQRRRSVLAPMMMSDRSLLRVGGLMVMVDVFCVGRAS